MAVFSCPKTLHRRRLTPGQLGTYQAYKAPLREEFFRRCVYCRVPDYGRDDEFGVDHYLPQKPFTDLALSYSNLYYCCNRCNRLKRDYWARQADLKAMRFVPNPCDHRMFEHLRYSDLRVEPHSKAGVFSEERLALNGAGRLELREMVEATAMATAKQLADSQHLLQQLDADIVDAPLGEKGELESLRAEVLADLLKLESKLSLFVD